MVRTTGRYIFLDFDGVMNSSGFLRAQAERKDLGPERMCGEHAIDPAAVAHLNRLVEATGAQVVISSSWRHVHSRTAFQEMLNAHGFKGLVRDKTPEHVPNTNALIKRAYGQRGDEIMAWLTEVGPIFGDVESFVVIDDNADMDAVRARFVQTSPDEGLTDAIVDKCIAVLAEPWEGP